MICKIYYKQYKKSQRVYHYGKAKHEYIETIVTDDKVEWLQNSTHFNQPTDLKISYSLNFLVNS
jgi:hypothetical protein